MSTKVNRRFGLGMLPFLILLATLCANNRNTPAGDHGQLTAEEVLTKHLMSIGTPENLAAAKTRLVAGSVLFTLRSPGSGQNSGLSILYSERNKSVIAMSFQNADYPAEKFGYDGDKLVVSFLHPGVRSTLGDFIFQRAGIYRDGLFGGVLSTAWPLLNFNGSKVKLEYGGLKKVDGRDAHVLRYVPKTGSDLKVNLFFDAETFQHVRTEYKQVVAAQMSSTAGGVDSSKERERDLHYDLEEQFSDFRVEGKLMLPHTYQIKLKLDRRQGATYLAEWKMAFNKFSFNQPLEPKWFDINAAAN
ncbi:MAG: hypothetical protein ABJC10_11215 [Acidobacteriota bacterium]